MSDLARRVRDALRARETAADTLATAVTEKAAARRDVEYAKRARKAQVKGADADLLVAQRRLRKWEGAVREATRRHDAAARYYEALLDEQRRGGR